MSRAAPLPSSRPSRSSNRWSLSAWDPLWRQRSFVLLMLLFLAGILGLVGMLYQAHRNARILYEQMALQGASMQMRMIRELRSLYSSEVVDRVLPYGIQATHDYQHQEREIPLPATLTMLLGQRLSERHSGAHVRLLSNYPFPWRTDRETHKDAFELEALEVLGGAPASTFHRFEDYEGRPSLRVAVADVMQESCVACHNQHPQSPKTDWQVGQVRGIVELIRPLDDEVAAADTDVKWTFGADARFLRRAGGEPASWDWAISCVDCGDRPKSYSGRNSPCSNRRASWIRFSTAWGTAWSWPIRRDGFWSSIPRPRRSSAWAPRRRPPRNGRGLRHLLRQRRPPAAGRAASLGAGDSRTVQRPGGARGAQ